MIVRIDSIDDPRITIYRNLKDKVIRQEGVLLAEGHWVAERMVRSGVEVVSLLVSDACVDEFIPLVDDAIPVYVAPPGMFNEIIGFKFHRGAIGCGRRPEVDTVDTLMQRIGSKEQLTLVVCPDVTGSENLGSIFRIAAGFGVDGVILGQHCCDPFSRRCVRVSMGTVFRLPLVQSSDLAADMLYLKRQYNVEFLATVLDEEAVPLWNVNRPKRTGVLFGNEADGLGDNWLTLCDQKITIPMKLGTDSLNLAVAAGVFIYALSPHA